MYVSVCECVCVGGGGGGGITTGPIEKANICLLLIFCLLQRPQGEEGKLTVTRKRSSRGGAMARRKRRLCSGEKRDTAPLLSMLPTSKTMTVEEVESQIKDLLDTLCEVQ